jgi:hypothetical protein
MHDAFYFLTKRISLFRNKLYFYGPTNHPCTLVCDAYKDTGICLSLPFDCSELRGAWFAATVEQQALLLVAILFYCNDNQPLVERTYTIQPLDTSMSTIYASSFRKQNLGPKQYFSRKRK